MKDYITPCPTCGLHADDTPKAWACDGCIETGVVKAKYGLDYVATLIRSGNIDEAVSYANKLEFVEEPTTIIEMPGPLEGLERRSHGAVEDIWADEET